VYDINRDWCSNMTALTGVYLRNFQSIKEPIFLQLDKLCFLYGPNSAGKSSILDALDLIKKTVTGETGGYRLEHFYGKNQNANWDLGIGVEVVSQKKSAFTGYERKDFDEWWESADQRGDYFHQQFFSKISGKKIQIEFGERGGCLKVAVEGKPLFEFDGGAIDYDDFFRRAEEEDNEPIFGRLIVYKNNGFNDLFDHEYKDFSSERTGAYTPMSSHFRDLFVEENESKIIIHGLNYDAGKEYQTNIVNISFSVEDVIFASYEHLKPYRSEDVEYQRFIEEQFNESTEQGQEATKRRRRVYWALESVARDFDKLIKGFFFQVQFGLQYTHVRGDRQILNSASCFSYPRYMNIEPKNCSLNQDDPMSRFARFLTGPTIYDWLKPSISGDFINKSLKDYLISLRGYQIYPEVFSVTKEDDSEATEKFVFLKVRHKSKDNLGFQDVGSGISYSFPILASLWASKLSLIEQPELHLHPSAQCELGDVFIAAYNKGSMAVVESHSEHMLLRILRRIRETTNDYLLPKDLKFTAKDLRIYYFKPEPDGFTSVKEIRVDSYGELLNTWPGGFFSERDRELFGE